MFPWLKPDSEVSPRNGGRNKQDFGQNPNKYNIGQNQKQSQSDQDLGRIHRDQDYRQPDPYYENPQQRSRGGRLNLDSQNYINSSPSEQNGFPFNEDHKHRLLEKNKQQYKDFYRDNVSQFQKQLNGQNAPSYESKKIRLQQEQREGENGLVTRLIQNNKRSSVSPSDYANQLKRQIEEKKEFQRQREEEENYGPRGRAYQEFQQEGEGILRPRNTKKTEPQMEESGPKRQILQLQKNVGFQNENFDPYSGGTPALRQQPQSFMPKDGSPPLRVVRSTVSQSGYDKREEPKTKNMMGEMFERDQRDEETRRMKKQQFYRGLEEQRRKDVVREDDKNGGRESERQKDFSWSRADKSIIDQLGENLERQEEKKAVQKVDLAEELMLQIKEKKRLQRLDKEKQELLDRKYEEKVKAEVNELKQKYETEMLGKQHEIKTLKKVHDKKKQENIEKLNESVVSKNQPKSPERSRVEGNHISPRDHMIGSQKYQDDQEHSNVGFENSRVETNILRDLNSRGGNELDLRFQRDRSQDSMQQYQNPQMQNHQGQGLQQQQQQQQSQQYIHQPPYQLPQSSSQQIQQQQQAQLQQLPHSLQLQHASQQRNAMLQAQKEEIFRKQEEMFAQREINNHWNPPQFWEFKDRKNEEELNSLRVQLDNQTSLLSSEAMKIRQDLRAAAEKKSQALVDLENLKNQLQRQNLNESNKLRELRQNMQNYNNNNNNQEFQASNSSKLAGAANMSLLNFSTFSQNANNSYAGSNGYLNSNRQNRQPEVINKFVQQNANHYGHRSSGHAQNASALDYKLEKRLNGINVDKADLQLLEVDNLLNNLRNPL